MTRWQGAGSRIKTPSNTNKKKKTVLFTEQSVKGELASIHKTGTYVSLLSRVISFPNQCIPKFENVVSP